MAVKKLGNVAAVLDVVEATPAGTERRHRGRPGRAKESDVIGRTLHSLSHQEIDRRIDCLTREVAERAEGGPAIGTGAGSPRWISAADLVDRLRPFLVYN